MGVVAAAWCILCGLITTSDADLMKCPFCHHEDTQVIDTRVSEEGDAVRRRRRCATCDKRFTTYERIELIMPMVVKKNGSRTDFDPAKLRSSFGLALRKRPVSAEVVDAAIHSIEEKLRSTGEREIISGRIGELVMHELKRMDKIAYIRFASVYKSFEDVAEFQDAIAEVGRERKPTAGN
jgi:transcriptional repressor NrdR